MKIERFGIAALMALAVVGLAGCETTVENPPSNTTVVHPTREVHTNTVVPVPGPSTNTTTNNTTVEHTTTPPPDGGSSSSSTSTSTTHTP